MLSLQRCHKDQMSKANLAQLLPAEKWTVQHGPHGLKHLTGAANGSKAACNGRWGLVTGDWWLLHIASIQAIRNTSWYLYQTKSVYVDSCDGTMSWTRVMTPVQFTQALSSWKQESLKSPHPKLPTAEELFGSEAPGSSDPCPPWCPTWSPKASKVETLRNPPTVPTLEVINGHAPCWPGDSMTGPEDTLKRLAPKPLGAQGRCSGNSSHDSRSLPEKKRDWRCELEKTSHTVQKMASFCTESKMQWRQANPDPVSAIRRTNSSWASCRWNCQEIFVVSLRYEFICLAETHHGGNLVCAIACSGYTSGRWDFCHQTSRRESKRYVYMEWSSLC